mmetsp:Transcript_50488/g.109618  ORF Transcript_50488/g.109618 Transcript_50488/m.109618 type:complete len:139 (+) Transcript_50488:2258-2674(+)
MQGVHVLLPLPEYSPTGQGAQQPPSSRGVSPAGQAMHTELAICDAMRPGMHKVHALLPVPEKRPTGHESQVVSKLNCVMALPASQSTQDPLPRVSFRLCPAGHAHEERSATRSLPKVLPLPGQARHTATILCTLSVES